MTTTTTTTTTGLILTKAMHCYIDDDDDDDDNNNNRTDFDKGYALLCPLFYDECSSLDLFCGFCLPN